MPAASQADAIAEDQRQGGRRLPSASQVVSPTYTPITHHSGGGVSRSRKSIRSTAGSITSVIGAT